MRIRWTSAVFVIPALTIFLLPTSVACAQTDVGISFYQAFNNSTSGNGVQQTVSNASGRMVELRHIQAPWIGYEVTFSLNPEDQTIAPVKGLRLLLCRAPASPFHPHARSRPRLGAVQEDRQHSPLRGCRHRFCHHRPCDLSSI